MGLVPERWILSSNPSPRFPDGEFLSSREEPLPGSQMGNFVLNIHGFDSWNSRVCGSFPLANACHSSVAAALSPPPPPEEAGRLGLPCCACLPACLAAWLFSLPLLDKVGKVYLYLLSIGLCCLITTRTGISQIPMQVSRGRRCIHPVQPASTVPLHSPLHSALHSTSFGRGEGPLSRVRSGCP